MGTVCFSETWVSTYESTRRRNLEQYCHLQRRENLKYHGTCVAVIQVHGSELKGWLFVVLLAPFQ